jgi:hypothetical protein
LTYIEIWNDHTELNLAHIGKNPAQQAVDEAAVKIAGSWVRPAQDGIIPFQPKRAEGE